MKPFLSALFRPGILILNRLHYPYKFALISWMFALPLAISLYLGMQEIHHTVEFTKKELAGTRYLKGVLSILADLQTRRGMMETWLSGGMTFRDQAERLQASIHTDIQHMNDLDQDLHALLDTTPLWKEFQFQWEQNQQEQALMTREESFKRHTKLIEGLLDLLAHVGARSNLILDPNLDSYHLIDAMIIRLPQWAEAIGQLRGLGAGIITRGSITTQERVQLGYHKAMLESIQDTVRRNFTIVFEENPDFEQALQHALQDSLLAGHDVADTVGKYVETGETSAPLNEYWQTLTSALENILRLESAVSPLVEQTLHTRMAAIMNRQFMLESVTFTALLLVLYMFISFYLSTVSSVKRMRDVSGRMLLGELDQTPMPAVGNDEMTEAVEAFRMVADVVKTKWQTAELEAARAREAEKSLKESEGRLRAIMDGAADGLMTINSRGIIKTFNAAASRIFGYPSETMIGRNISDIIPIPHHQTHEEYLEDYLHLHETGPGSQRRNVEGIRKDGTLFPLDIHLSTVPWTQPPLFTAIIRDLTDQRMAERRTQVHQAVTQVLAESPALDDAMSRLLQAIGEGLLWRVGALWQENEPGTALHCVKVWQHQQDAYAEFEAVTRSTTFPRGIGLPGRVWDSGEAAWVVDVIQDNNFPRKWVAEKESLHGALAFPIRLQGGKVGVMEFFNDRVLEPDYPMLVMFHALGSQISEFFQKKQAEACILAASQELEHRNMELIKTRDQALIAVQAKSQFLATLSHEIRTPLNGIIGLTEILLSTDLTSDQRDMQKTILTCSTSLLRLLNDILDFSKMNAGKLELEYLAFDLRTVVEEVLELLSSHTLSDKVELLGFIHVQVPTTLIGDAGRLRQILVNLIGNALKFTEAGEVSVEITPLAIHHDRTTIHVEIRDTGIGIEPEARRHLFEPFQQSDTSMARKYGGTGLGLAICHQLVQLMEGTIEVDSTPGAGSCFGVTLPFRCQQQVFAPPPLPALKGIRVCVIDDNQTHLRLLTHYMGSWGMVCRTVTSGHELLTLLSQSADRVAPFDLLVLDHSIPDMDVRALGRAIQEQASVPDMPMILLKVLGEAEPAPDVEQPLFAASVRKPVQYGHLHQACLSALEASTHAIQPDPVPPGGGASQDLQKEGSTDLRRRVLLAEDNPTNQQIALRMLTDLGLHTDVVNNGFKAISAIAERPYDLVLMDCQMPEMDGLTATAHIRKHVDPDHHIPIVALTANALAGDRERCLNIGMDDFLAKPVSRAQLEQLLYQWLPQFGPPHISKPASATTQGLPAPHPGEPAEDPGEGTPLYPLDVQVLQELRNLEGDEAPDFFLMVVDQFLMDLPRHLETIQVALEQGDADACMKAAHACKGSCRSIGAKALADISQELEARGREGNLHGTADIWKQWMAAHHRTREALQRVRDESVDPSGAPQQR